MRRVLKLGSAESISKTSEGMEMPGRIMSVSKTSKEMILTSRGMEMDVKDLPRIVDKSMRALVFSVPKIL